MMTKSGRADIANISGGMVAWELSLAQCPARSPCIWSLSESVARIPQENAVMPPGMSAL